MGNTEQLMKDALRTIETLKARVAELESRLNKSRGGAASVQDAIGKVVAEGVVSGNPLPGFDTRKLFKDRTHFKKARELKAARTPEEKQAIILKYREKK